MDDHYTTLRVRPDASRQEIERSYRRLARTYHPDLLSGASPETRRRAEETLKRVNLAHHVLGDPRRRRDYDQERARRAARATGHPAGRTRVPAPPRRPAPAETTTHWGAGGPIDIEWAAPPPRRPRPDTDIFSTARLARWSAAIVLFALLLAFLWRPGADPAAAPAPPTPTVVVTRPAAFPTNAPPLTPSPR